MGRHQKPKNEKMAAGTYRPDRDKSQTVQIQSDTPDAPLSLEKEGQRFWADAYRCEWITTADQHEVQLVAEKKDERVLAAKAYKQDPADSRLARALQNIDRDIQAGLEQLLMTPHARKRAGVVVETAPPKPTKQALMMNLARGDITREEYERKKKALDELDPRN